MIFGLFAGKSSADIFWPGEVSFSLKRKPLASELKEISGTRAGSVGFVASDEAKIWVPLSCYRCQEKNESKKYYYIDYDLKLSICKRCS
jgi:hypothetical protein